MKKISLYCLASAVAVLSTGVYSCKKVNGIDNSQVIQTPYSLYFADTAGGVYNTNNGKDINPTVFRADGKPVRAIVVSGNNLLFAKNNLYLSINNGLNFNHSFDSLNSIPYVTCTGTDTMNLDQSMLLDIPAWNKLYALTNVPVGLAADYFGLAFSDNHGVRGSWHFDGTYDTTGDMGSVPVTATSMTQMTNGVMAVLALHSDGMHIRNLWVANDAGYIRWRERTGNPTGIGGIGGLDQSGTPLPPNTTNPNPGYFTLGHLNNRLIAIDHTCQYGAFYSDDTGKNWIQSSGLPASTPMLCVASPFEEICLIGTGGKGLYVLNTQTNAWESNNRGLGGNLIIRSIVGKQNIYKNGTVQKYIYLATNQGIYQSTNDGLDWTKTIPGNFVAIY